MNESKEFVTDNNVGSITVEIGRQWLHETITTAGVTMGYSRCPKCSGCVDGYVNYRYCPHCGWAMKK